MYLGLAGTVGTQRPEGYRDIREYWGLLGGVGTSLGVSQGVGVSGVYWRAGRDSRYSGARRGIGSSGKFGSF